MRHLTLLVLLVLMSGCGQTGPLYLPGQAPGSEADENAAAAPQQNAP